mgnify:CR=1 FL=1
MLSSASKQVNIEVVCGLNSKIRCLFEQSKSTPREGPLG